MSTAAHEIRKAAATELEAVRSTIERVRNETFPATRRYEAMCRAIAELNAAIQDLRHE